MKKIIGLACLLVIVAALVVPMAVSAAETPVTGTVTYATVTVKAPSAITWTIFQEGWNVKNSATAGSVTVKAGTSGVVNATVTARRPREEGQTYGSGWMNNGTRDLDTYLLIGTESNTGPWQAVNGEPITVQGNVCTGPLTKTLSSEAIAPGTTKILTFSFFAAQWITHNDATTGASTAPYTIPVEFTATCLP